MKLEADSLLARQRERAVDAAEVARQRRQRLERALSLASPALLLVVWEIVARAALIDTRFFPAPTASFAALADLLASGELTTHVAASASRVVVGFLLGAVPGIAIGLVMGVSPLVRASVQPLVAATFPIPKIAILPLVILIFGLGEASKWAIIAIGVFFIALINTLHGVLSVPRIYFDVGRTVGASRLAQYLTIAFPGALPSILTGVQLGLGIALIVLVAAEFVGAKSGIGYLIWYSWQTFLIDRMYAGLVVVALLGFGVQLLLDWLEARLVPWRGR